MTYGYLAEFKDEEGLLTAARSAWEAGYRKLDAYCPYPVHELAAAVGHPESRLPWVIFFVGLLGGLSAFFMQWYATVVSFTTNVGGRPLGSTPSYMPITFELTVLFATFAGLIGMFWANNLPELHHPLFAVPSFVARASQDGFFLCIETKDPRFDAVSTRAFLDGLGATEVVEV